MFPKLGRKFQFHKGTIKPQKGLTLLQQNINFNSIKVRLNLSGATRGYIRLLDFNSIKVRLNLNLLKFLLLRMIFQFHKGTIKPQTPRNFSQRHIHFNSIKVRLNQGAEHYYESFEGNFNSIKVRLNQRVKGDKGFLYTHFNSIKVRLNPSLSEYSWSVFNDISIP